MTRREADIEALIGEYLVLAENPENQCLLVLWESEQCTRGHWYGRPITGKFARARYTPLTVDLQNSFWLQLSPVNIAAAYPSPTAYLRFFLQRRIYGFRHISDDTPLDGGIYPFMGTPFESSFFGVPVRYFPDRDANIGPHPVASKESDLERLCKVEVSVAGMMSQAYPLYEGMVEIARGRLYIGFPGWLRGPLWPGAIFPGLSGFPRRPGRASSIRSRPV